MVWCQVMSKKTKRFTTIKVRAYVLTAFQHFSSFDFFYLPTPTGFLKRNSRTSLPSKNLPSPRRRRPKPPKSPKQPREGGMFSATNMTRKPRIRNRDSQISRAYKNNPRFKQTKNKSKNRFYQLVCFSLICS